MNFYSIHLDEEELSELERFFEKFPTGSEYDEDIDVIISWLDNIAERGAEAVVPMTNQQSLETIGRTIAKYTKFDANVTLELEGRILARVMQEINSDRNFARNGG